MTSAIRHTTLLVTLAALSMVGACTSDNSSRPAEAPARTVAADDSWVSVTGADELSVLEGRAQVAPARRSQVRLSVATPSQVLSLLVQEGDVVAQGDPLLDLRLPELAQAAARYEGLRSLRAEVKRQRDDLAKLVERGLVRRGEERALSLRLSEIDAEMLESASLLRAAGLSPARAHRLAASGGAHQPVAAMAGTVTEVEVVEGSLVPSGEAMVTIVASSSDRVEASVPPTLDPELEAFFVELGGAVHPLETVSVAPSRDEHTGMARAWYRLKEGPLPVGTPGSVRFGFGDASKVVSLPSETIDRRTGRPRVWKRRHSKTPVAVEVEVVGSARGRSLVRGELAVGDAVATDPLRMEEAAP